MKKILYTVLFLFSALVFGQDKGITYQAVIYLPGGKNIPGVDIVNVPMSNRPICLKFSFVDSSSNLEYEEVVKTTTDEFGMVNLVIGIHTQTGGYASSFGAIVWDLTGKRLKVALDSYGVCSEFEEISNGPLSSVPFAYAAVTANTISGVVDLINGGTGATTAVEARANLGLGNVNNTSDASKPISTATQTALNAKENTANKSLDIIQDGASDIKFPSVKAVKTYVDNQLGSGSATVVDADATTKGTIQLAGDLSGTAAVPTVPGLALKENTTNKSLDVTADGTSDLKFPSVKAVKTYVDTAITGATIVDADASTKGKIQLAGDLSGTAALPTVPGLALKENATNKSLDVAVDGASDVKFPSVKAVKTYVDTAITGATIVDADAATKGKIQLTGDLSGTADLPRITANAITTSKIADTAITDAKIATVSATKITGFVDIANGGTGATTPQDARTNLGLGTASTNNTSDFEVPLTVSAPLVRTVNALSIPTATATVNGYLSAADFNTFATKIDRTEKAANNGVATLGNDGKIPSDQIPAISFQSANVVTSQAAMIAIAGAQVGSIAIRTDINKNFVLSALPATTLSNWLELSTPTAVTSVNGNAGPNVVLTKSDLVLGNVDNTSDINKPISNDTRDALALKANLASPTFTGTVSGITKAMVGLAQVDNTSDASKPVSAATQTALNLKANAADVTTALALKENAANKSTTTTLGTSDVLFPTQNAVKTYADAKVVDGITDGITTSAPTQNAVFDALALKANAADVTTSLALKANTTDVTTSLALKENRANKSTATDLGSTNPSDDLYPSQKAVKAYVDLQSANAGVADSSITSAKILDGTLVTADFANGSVTPDKISGILPVVNGGTGASTVLGAKTNLGLENVNNTSDAAKPVSTATQTALDLKSNVADVTTSLATKEDAANKSTTTTLGTSDVLFPTQNAVKTYVDTNITTVNATTTALQGIVTANATAATTAIAAVQADVDANETAANSALALKANLASPTFTGTVSGIDKTMVGLGNVEDTALSTWAGSTNVTTVGTITSGTWNGSVIGSNKGGAGTTNGLLKADGTGVVSAAVAGTDYQAPLVAGTNYLVPNAAITGATKTKITYDAKGLVTAGADATTADIAPSTDKNYVTDAQATVLSNTSGSNTGDQTITLTGDVTGTGTGSFVTTIANNAVTNAKIVNEAITYAKIQNVAADKVLGRTTSGSGVVEEIATTGIGNVVRAESPTLVTPELGVANATSVEFPGSSSGSAILAAPADAGSAIITLPSATGTLATLDGAETLKNKTLENPILTAPAIGAATASTVSFAGATSGSSTIAAPAAAGATNIILPAVSGTLATLDGVETLTNKTLTAPVLGVATATSINKVLITQPLNNATLTITDGKTLTAADDATVSGTNTGDETDTTIKTKLGITTLSGSNTGDQTTITGNAGTATKLAAPVAINDVPFDGSAPITVTADAGTLTGTELKSTVTTSSLTSVGTLTNLTVTNPIAGSITGNAATATSATTATNIAGGAAGSIPYQTAAATTAMLAKGSDGKVLTLVSGLPSWETAPGISSVGSINATAVPEGAVISSGALKLAPADGTNGGVVTNGTQTFGGAKTFSTDVTVNGITIGEGGGSVSTNTAIGLSAISSNATGIENTAVGNTALNVLSSGTKNTAIGSQAAKALTSGNDNVVIGYQSLLGATNAEANTSIGNYSLKALNNTTTNDRNTSIGAASLANLASGQYNASMGQAALNQITSGSNNVAIGRQAGYQNVSSANVTTANQSVFIGADTKPSATTSTNEIIIGFGAQGNGNNTSTLGNSSILKSRIYGTLTTVPSAEAASGVGESSTIEAQGSSSSSAAGNVTIKAGNNSSSGAGGDINLTPGTSSTGTAGKVSVNGGDMLVNGLTIGRGKSNVNTNTALGINTLSSNTSEGTSNTAVGSSSLYKNAYGKSNTAIGNNALYYNTGTSGSPTYGSGNNAIGASSLYQNTTGYNNTAIGNSALNANTTGFNNVAIGNNAMSDKSSTYYQNVAIGHSAMRYANGNGNTAIGYNAGGYIGYNGTAGAGEENIFIGYSAGSSAGPGNSPAQNTTGNKSVMIGLDARPAANGDTNEIVIAGSVDDPSGNLGFGSHTTTIGNASTTKAIIYGSTSWSNLPATYASGPGGNFNLTTQHAGINNWKGGDFSITAGNGLGTGAGGNITLNPGTTGTGTPGKVVVNGQIKITGGTPGLGKVLTSDAAGLATWETSSSGGVSTLGTFSSTPSLTGGTISGSTLTLAAADATNPGLVSTAAQTFAGAKTFSNTTTFNSDIVLNGITIGLGAGSVSTNQAIGINALNANTNGFQNTAAGYQALYTNTSSTDNTAFGYKALNKFNNTTNNANSGGNTAFGSSTLSSTTTGNQNTAVGLSALRSNTTGSGNVAVGVQSLDSNSSGLYNTAIGSAALYTNSSGGENTALGRSSGGTNTTGTKNTFLGASTDVGASALTNATAIGYGAVVGASNSIQLGNTSVTNVKTSGTLTAGSVIYPKTYGTAGQVLTDNGSGALYWTTPSSGGVSTFVYDGSNTTLVAGGSIGSGTLTIGAATVNRPGFVSAATQTFGGVKTFSPTITAASGSAVGTAFTPSLTAAANNDALIGVDINPYFSNGAYTGLSNYSLRVTGGSYFSKDLNVNTTFVGTGRSAYNIAIGASGNLGQNTNGQENIAIGNSVLSNFNNATANTKTYNIGMGYYALSAASNVGTNNIAIGQYALKENTDGKENVAIGSQSLYNNTSGKYNTAIGTNAMATGTIINNENVAVGYYSLYKNTAGANTGVGSRALYSNTSGSDNSGFGAYSLWTNATGRYNTGIGSYTLRNINGTGESGSYNTALGFQAGMNVGSANSTNITGRGSLFLGYDTRPLADGDINEVVISGYAGDTSTPGAVGLGSHTTLIGNTSTTKSQIYGALTVVPNAATSGDGNSSTIAAQNGFTNSNGGALNLTAGNGNGSGNGGDINLTPGAKGNTGAVGKVVVNGQVKITGGSPAINKVLVSDANGLASWANPLPSAVYGTLSPDGSAPTLSSNGTGSTPNTYLNSYITLPPGKWDVSCNILTDVSEGNATSGTWWIRLRFDTSSTTVDWSIPNNIDFPVNKLISGRVTAVKDSKYDLVQGHVIIHNTSGSDKTYYLWADACDLNGANSGSSLRKLSSAGFGENLIMALPMY